MAKNRAGAFLGGILLGTAVGTAVGLLVAPRTGKETRRFLRKSADALPEVAGDVSSNLQEQTERLLDSAQRSLDDTLVRLQSAISTGREAMQQKQQELQKQLKLGGDRQLTAAQGKQEQALEEAEASESSLLS